MHDELHERIAAAHGEALQVGDSAARSDQLAAKLRTLAASLAGSGLSNDAQNRVRDALATAERVLRRDDDGREAARHLNTALGHLAPRARKPSPFLDDAP
jgi:hypothetical protein